MKKYKYIVIGGIQSKIFNLVLITSLLLVGAFLAVILYQTDNLTEVSTEMADRQQGAISEIASQTMDGVISGSLTQSTQLEAYMADQMFRELKSTVELMGLLTTQLYNDPAAAPNGTASGPDAANQGQVRAQLLYAEGVDPGDPQIAQEAERIGRLSDTMESLYTTNGQINACFIASADGIFMITDERSEETFMEDGSVRTYTAWERPWYPEAAEAGELVFTDLEVDYFSGEIGIVCAMPVYRGGELVAVVGADLFLTSMQEFIAASGSDTGFLCIINENGHVIFSPMTEGQFQALPEDEAEDLRTSGDGYLNGFVNEALNQPTDVQLLVADGHTYYMVGAPISTVGWAVLSAVDKAATDMPEQMMTDRMREIGEDAAATMSSSFNSAKWTITVLVAVVLLLAIITALIMGKRIVNPLEKMTKRVTSLGGEDLLFRMEKDYRTGDEVEVLAESFADLSNKTLQYVDQVKTVTAEKERIGAELGMASAIQENVLPRIFPPYPDRNEFDLYATMTPAKEVGGDFYDFFLVDSNHLAMVMADVSGKGVPAALFMMIAKTLIKNRVQSGESPSEALANVNMQLMEGNQAEMFVTVWLAILELSTGRGIAANAGHEHPVLRKAGGQYELIKYRHSPAVAVMEGMVFREHEFTLEPGDTLFVYTDGVAEASNTDNELFGTDRLLEALNRDPDDSPKEMLEHVMDSIEDFVEDAEQFDDITMLCLKYWGSEQQKGQSGMTERTFEASVEALGAVTAFVDEQLERADCPMKAQMKIDLCVEELFVNIAHYAYPELPEGQYGEARISVEAPEGGGYAEITFTDSGIPYDPLAKIDPDVTLDAEQRQIGGLGIFLVKKNMDDVRYRYEDGKNILTIRKDF